MDEQLANNAPDTTSHDRKDDKDVARERTQLLARVASAGVDAICIAVRHLDAANFGHGFGHECRYASVVTDPNGLTRKSLIYKGNISICPP